MNWVRTKQLPLVYANVVTRIEVGTIGTQSSLIFDSHIAFHFLSTSFRQLRNKKQVVDLLIANRVPTI
jgi:hypothetical protein